MSLDERPTLLAIQHVELADLIVLRALARASAGEWPSLLGHEITGLDEIVFTRLADAAIARATRVDPVAALAVLSAIRDQIILRNEHDPCLIRLVDAMGNTARAAGAHDAAIDAWDWLLVTHDNRVFDFGDRIVYMNDGRVEREETAASRSQTGVWERGGSSRS